MRRSPGEKLFFFLLRRADESNSYASTGSIYTGGYRFKDTRSMREHSSRNWLYNKYTVLEVERII